MLLTAKEYQLSPLSLTAKVKFREWVREETMAEAKRRIDLYGDTLDRSERRAIIDRSLALIDNGRAETVLMDTVEGKRMLAWLHLQPSHPGITLEEAGALIPYLQLSILDARLESVNGLGGDGDAEAQPPQLPTPTVSTPAAANKEPDPEERRKAVFDGMVKRSGLTLKELVDLPIAAAAAIYLQETGGKEVSHLKLKARLYEYAKASGALDEPSPASEKTPHDVQAFVQQLNAHAGQTVDAIVRPQ